MKDQLLPQVLCHNLITKIQFCFVAWLYHSTGLCACAAVSVHHPAYVCKNLYLICAFESLRHLHVCTFILCAGVQSSRLEQLCLSSLIIGDLLVSLLPLSPVKLLQDKISQIHHRTPGASISSIVNLEI